MDVHFRGGVGSEHPTPVVAHHGHCPGSLDGSWWPAEDLLQIARFLYRHHDSGLRMDA